MIRTMIRRTTRLLTGTALGLGLAFNLMPADALAAPVEVAAVAASASDGPALWVVRDEDSTIYLFGTVHVLKPDTDWCRPEIQAAFDASSELWLEVANVDDMAVAVPLIQRLGISQDKSLFDGLTTNDLNRIQLATLDLGLPMEALSPFRPWYAGMTLSMAPLTKAGYDPTSGVEMVLKAEAVEDGKVVKGFETIEQQLNFFAGLPEPVQLAYLRQTLDDYSEATTMLDELVADWAEGDIASLDRDVGQEMKREAPVLFKALLADRNADWAEQIEDLMEGSGTSFIAVGAGHLTGADSVQVYLARKGITAERI